MAPFLRLGGDTGDTGDSAPAIRLATATGSDWRFGWHPFPGHPFPGWRSHYGFSEVPSPLQEVEKWI
ncbi:MAG TPA: hypothetical protein VLQ45_22060, partial [Thermoanaerobaculia bacterium]|nr:hypothetical protein [Thermoanaerobaculia bacterium]